MQRIVVPPTKTQEEAEVGTAAGAKDIADKEPFYRRGGIQKERVIVLCAGRRYCVIKFPVPTLRYLMACPGLSSFQSR